MIAVASNTLNRSNGAYLNASIQGMDECLGAFQGLSRDLRKAANGEIRDASKAIGNELIGWLQLAAVEGAAPPQAPAVAEAARVRRDRYVVVAVPGVNLKLSGIGKSRGRPWIKYQIAWATEIGSDWAQFHTPRGSGGWIRRNRDAWAARAVPKYTAAIATIARKYGLL